MKKNQAGPKTAIIMRTKNRPLLLARAFDSVAGQTYKNWQLIVVNDCGEPGPVNSLFHKYAGNFKGRGRVLHRKKSLGMEDASNAGLARAKAVYGIIHDDDDSWSPEFLARCVPVLERKRKEIPSVAGIICHSDRVVEKVEGSRVKVERTEPFNHHLGEGVVSLNQMIVENLFPPISFLFSLEACRKVGGFDAGLPVLGDWDFNIRFLKKYDIWIDPRPLAFYHHRLEEKGVLGNSVIAGVDRHKLYRNILLNKWTREEIGKSGSLGFLSEMKWLLNSESRKIDYLADVSQKTERLLRFASKMEKGIPSPLAKLLKKILRYK